MEKSAKTPNTQNMDYLYVVRDVKHEHPAPSSNRAATSSSRPAATSQRGKLASKSKKESPDSGFHPSPGDWSRGAWCHGGRGRAGAAGGRGGGGGRPAGRG